MRRTPKPDPSGASAAACRRIELRQHLVHISTARLMLDLRARRMVRADYAELGEVYAMAVVATDPDSLVLAVTVGRGKFEEVAVAALDKAIAVVAGGERAETGEVWKLTRGRISIVTDDQTPFSSERFREAVATLGCRHQVQPRGR